MPSSKIQSYEEEPTFSPSSPSPSSPYYYDQTTTTATASPVAVVALPSSSSSSTSLQQPPKVLNGGNKTNNYVYISTRRPVQLSSCPNCAQQHVSTLTRTKVTGKTWACVGVGALIFWPLCWIPLVADSLKQTNHYCQNCKVKVGRVKPFQ